MTKCKKWTKKILTGGLALLLAVSSVATCLPAPVFAESLSQNAVHENLEQTMVVEEESKYAFDGIKYDVKTLTLNGQELTTDTSVKNGDILKISMGWFIGDQTTGTHFETDLTPLVHLELAASSVQNLKNPSGDSVGTFYIDNTGKLIIDITDEKYFNENSKYGNIQIDGVINVENDDIEDGEPISVQIENKSYTVKFDKNVAASQLNTEKSANGGVYLDTDGKFKQKFDLNLTAQYGDIKNIQITDTPGNKLSNMSEIQVVDAGGTALAGPYGTFDDVNAALASETLAANKSIRLQYTMEIEHSPNPEWNAYFNNATVTYDNSNDEEKTNSNIMAWTQVKNPTLQKSGALVSADSSEVEWTLTLDIGDYQKLLDADPSLGLDDIVDNITDTLGSGFNEASVSPVPTVDNYTKKEGSVYTWVCTSSIKDEYFNNAGGATVKNDASVTIDEQEYKAPTATVTLPASDWVEKSFSSFDRGTGILTWNITLTPPVTATNVRIFDSPAAYVANPGSHLLLNDIEIDGVVVVADGNIVESPAAKAIINGATTALPAGNGAGTLADWGTAIGLQDDYVLAAANASKPITVTCKTKVNDASMAGKNYQNQAQVKYTDIVVGDKEMDPVYAVFRDKGSSLTKEGQVISGQNAIAYKIKVNLKDLDLDQKYPFVITDNIPEDLKLRNGSYKATVQDLWGNVQHTESSAYVVMSGNTATMTVPVTDEFVAAAKNLTASDPYLIITYEAEVKDETKLILDGKGVYTNEATGKYGEEFIGTGKTTNTLVPQSIVSKNYNYNEYTAPDVEYTIEVNPNRLMLVNGGKLTAVDSLGADSVLSYKLNTIVVQKNENGAWVNLVKGTDYKLAYDDGTKTVTISELPDGTYLRIKYSCFVGIQEGNLSSDNATNNFSLSGFDSEATKKSNSINRVVVNSTGMADSELASIKLFKYWNNGGNMEALKDAKFRLSRVTYDEDLDAWVDDTSELVGGEAGTADSAVVLDNIVTAEDGTYVINKLSRSRVYKLEEIEAPSGFAIGEAYYFVVSAYTGSVDPAILEAKNVKSFVTGAEIKYENQKTDVVRTGSLTFNGSKKIGSESDLTGYDFDFSVMELSNGASLTEEELKNNPSIGVEVAKGSNDLSGNITFDTLNYSSSTIKKAGIYYYKIYEKGIDSSKAYKNDFQIDENYYIAVVEVADSATEDDKFDVNVTGITKYTKNPNGTYTATAEVAGNLYSYDFVNEKVEKKGTYVFKAKKTIDGSGDLSDVYFTDGFEVRSLTVADATTDAANNPAGTAIDGGLYGSNNDYGAISFTDSIQYSSNNPGDIGTHYYKIYERDLTDPLDKDYKKDYTYYIIEVSVAEETGNPDLVVTTEEIRKFTSSDGLTWTDAGTLSNEIVPFDNKSIEKTGNYTFSAAKTVNGIIPTAGQEFNFKIEKLASATATSGTIVATGQNNTDTDGNISFVNVNTSTPFELSFRSNTDGDVGKHYYKVSETTETGGDFVVDSSWYLVELTVENISGETALTVTPKITRYTENDAVGTVVTDMVFNNLRTPTATVEFTAKKTLDGGLDFNGKEFDFEIYKLNDDQTIWEKDSTGKVLNTQGKLLTDGTNDTTTGIVSFEKGDSFSSLKTEDTGNHYYKIYEKDLSAADANDYEKDSAYYIVTVTVTITADPYSYTAEKTNIEKYIFNEVTGQYELAGNVTEDAVVFDNETKEKTGKLLLETGVKTVDGAAPNKVFTFDVEKLSDSTVWTDALLLNNPAGTLLYSVSNVSASGEIVLNSPYGFVEEYSSEEQEDLGTHYYKISEKDLSAADEEDYTKDPNYYIVKATVSNISGQADLSVVIDDIYKYTYNVNTSKYVRSVVSATTPGAIAFNNKTVVKTGTLALEKTVLGLGAGTDCADAIEFTITPGIDGVRPNTVFKLSDFTKNGDTYEKVLTNVPVGSYTVKETKYNVDGYLIQSVTYVTTAEGGTPVSVPATTPALIGSAVAEAEVEDGKVTSVEIENKYVADEGSLTISKTVTGGLAMNDVKNTLEFRVTDGVGQVVATITGDQLTLDGEGNYSYTIDHLPSGTYYVTEICDEVEGYTRTTTYKVGTGATQSGTNATGVISSVKDENVLFTNRYEAKPIKLRIQKTITGVSKVEADGQILPTISFAIKKGAVTVQTVTLNAGDYASGVYEKTITNLTPGTYTIEETAGDVDVYTLNGTDSSVVLNGGSANTGGATTAEFVLKFGDVADVSYTNDYSNTSIMPYIRIGKSVKGDLNWQDIKNKISFTITDGNGGPVNAVNGDQIGVIIPSDNPADKYYFEQGADGNYYCTISLEKNTGTTAYKVREDCNMSSLAASYTLTRTYQIDSAASVETSSGVADLTGYSDNVGKTVLYTNTYTEKKGSLQLIKNFEGLTDADGANEALVKDITYTIKPGIDGTESSTHKLSDFTRQPDGTYKIAFNQIPVGIYHVTESHPEVEGYNYQTTAIGVTEDGMEKLPQTGLESDVEVKVTALSVVNFSNVYEQQTGKLVITKALVGNVPKDVAENNIEFTVLNNATGEMKHYKLSDFTYNASTGKYVKELETPIGSYTVKETLYDIEGFVLRQVTTSLNGQAPVNNNMGTVQVVNGGISTVDMVNEYTDECGKLLLTKTLKGDATKAEAEAVIQFKVTNTDTGVTNTYKLTDFVYDEVSQCYTKELQVACGGYIIEETAYNIDGYAIESVTYSINGSTPIKGNKAEAAVLLDDTTKVDFTDTYTKETTTKTGRIRLTKGIWGYPKQEDLLDTVKFEVKNNDNGLVQNYSLRDFVYDAQIDYYYLDLDVVPGGYTITETATDASGLKLVCVAYTLGERENNFDFIISPTLTVQVSKDDVVKINFVNEYREAKISTPHWNDTTITTTTTTTTITTTKVPKTGDEMPLGAMVAGAISTLLLGLGCMSVYLKRRKQK